MQLRLHGSVRAGRSVRLAITLTCCLAPVHGQSAWTDFGPAPIANGPYTGRVAAIATSRTKADTWFVGGADGGVFRTDDAGVTWRAIGDAIPTTATGALCVHPGDDNTIWVGTGEANFAHHSRYGLGIAKTVDGGVSWVVYGSNEFAGRCIARICVDPKNPAKLFAASTPAGGFLPARSAAREHPLRNGPVGVFRSLDGGEHWTQLAGGLPTGIAATDLVIDPANPTTLYAAIGDIFGNANNGIYKTTDGGASWSKLGGGLPSGTAGRVSLAICASRPQRLVAIFVNPASSSGGSATTQGVYLTDDSGATWSAKTAAGSFQSTYGWYLSVAAIHPTAPDTCYTGGLSLRRSTNGGASFSTITPPHVDLHALEFDAAGRLVCGNDGGVHVSSNLGSSWLARNDGLGLIQLYAGMSVDPAQPDRVWGGFQDNGSCQRIGPRTWSSVLGGDGGCTAIDPSGQRVFVENQGTGNLYRSVNGGGSFSRSSSGISGSDRNCFLPPFAIDASNASRMVYGTQRIYESTNGGTSWIPISGDLTNGGTAAIHGLAIAPSDGRFVYVKTNDGNVQVTEDGGTTWNKRLMGVPGWVRTTRPFAIDPGDPRHAWLAVGAFSTSFEGGARLLETTDAGRTWLRRSATLPDTPVHCVAIDTRHSPAFVYVGTDRGVFRSVDGGEIFHHYGVDLPNVPVIDMHIDPARSRIVVATQGRGVHEARLLARDEVFARPTIR
ncbi:MAG: hypothetical protein H6832_12850 [Planctomycetes bacterium]|nr:hypothetical protein [Planctomycetota bacterium]